MQTTLNIDEAIVERLYAEAKRRGTTASALAEAAIRQILGEEPVPAKTAGELFDKLPKWRGGKLLVDITDREELYRVMDEYDGKPLPELPKLPPGPMLVDISDREELYRVMDEYDGFRY